MLIKLICGLAIYGLSSTAGQRGPTAPDDDAMRLSVLEAYDMSAAAQLRPGCGGGCGVRQLLAFPGQ